MPFWLVSLPLASKRKDAAWELLQERTTGLSHNSKLDIPELRVGTLDTLMQLSDDLAKTNNFIEVVVTKLRRQVQDLGGPLAATQLRVKGLTAEAYLTRFKWNEAKFQAKRPLKELVEIITESVSKIEDDLKVKLADYNNIKGMLGAVARKAGGSLAVRDISTLVKPQQLVDSENMTTAFVVISKFAIKEWESSYERLCNFVVSGMTHDGAFVHVVMVPRSSKLISEDNDYALVSVVLFKRVIDDFKTACRSKGFQVREYKTPSADCGDLSTAQVEQLKRDVESKKTGLEQWSKTAFEEAFSSWVHLIAIRLFVESILRYGLPPAYQAAVLVPADKSEVKLRSSLNLAFGGGKGEMWTDAEGIGGTFAGLAGDSEMYPYVSFGINMEV